MGFSFHPVAGKVCLHGLWFIRSIGHTHSSVLGLCHIPDLFCLPVTEKQKLLQHQSGESVFQKVLELGSLDGHRMWVPLGTLIPRNCVSGNSLKRNVECSP